MRALRRRIVVAVVAIAAGARRVSSPSVEVMRLAPPQRSQPSAFQKRGLVFSTTKELSDCKDRHTYVVSMCKAML